MASNQTEDPTNDDDCIGPLPPKADEPPRKKIKGR